MVFFSGRQTHSRHPRWNAGYEASGGGVNGAGVCNPPGWHRASRRNKACNYVKPANFIFASVNQASRRGSSARPRAFPPPERTPLANISRVPRAGSMTSIFPLGHAPLSLTIHGGCSARPEEKKKALRSRSGVTYGRRIGVRYAAFHCEKRGERGWSDQTVGRTSTEGFLGEYPGFSATNEPGFQRANSLTELRRQFERFYAIPPGTAR